MNLLDWRPPKALAKYAPGPMVRMIALYGLALAAGTFVLEWLQYKYLAKVFATEIYIGLIALGFTGLGIWAGYRLTPKVAAAPFERNDAAIKSLGLTDRECQILELLAAGQANKEIARTLDVSPNTVKTHIANLFQKLQAERRTQAIQKARELKILP
jgi:DNA-binding CsgD family transcriptional regulator